MKYFTTVVTFLVLLPKAVASDDALLYPVAMVRAVLSTDAPKPQNKTSRQTLRLGTAFLIDGGDNTRRWMVTCAHVIKYADAIRVDFSRTQWARVTEVYCDEGHDLALLRLEVEAPPTLAPLRLRDTELRDDEKRFMVIGFARGIGPHKTKVSAERHGTIKGKNVGLRDSDLKFDPEAECFEVGVVGEVGASGSAMVDFQDRVVGVYIAGWNGKSQIGYCTSSRYIRDLAKATRIPMNADRNTYLNEMVDYEVFSLQQVASNPYTRSMRADAPPTTMVLGQMPGNQVFERFFKTNDMHENAIIKKSVDEAVGKSNKKINHVTNVAANAGFLVPEGYELSERLDEDSGGYTLSISRPRSLNKVRLYCRQLPAMPEDISKDEAEFRQEIATFFSDVLKISPLGPGSQATRPGEADIGPQSWSALYRDKQQGCLVTFRTYIEPSRSMVHVYSFELCRRTGSFQVSGISSPLTVFANSEPTDESKELEFVLTSLYDLDLGIERSRQLLETEDLIVVRHLPTPMPGAGPGELKSGLPTTFPPTPGSPQQQPWVPNQSDRNNQLRSHPNGGQTAPPRSLPVAGGPPMNGASVPIPTTVPGPFAQQPVYGCIVLVEYEYWVPSLKPEDLVRRPAIPPSTAAGGAPQIALRPTQVESFIPELGIYVEYVRLRTGSAGARLTRNPVPNSPASLLRFGNIGPVSLKKGDTIYAVDGIPMGIADMRLHFGWTWIDYIEATTNQSYRGITLLPQGRLGGPARK